MSTRRFGSPDLNEIFLKRAKSMYVASSFFVSSKYRVKKVSKVTFFVSGILDENFYFYSASIDFIFTEGRFFI